VELFGQYQSWSAVAFSFPRGLVLFENPRASNPLTDGIREYLFRLRWFDFVRSRVGWPQGARLLADQVDDDRKSIEGVAQRARWHW